MALYFNIPADEIITRPDHVNPTAGTDIYVAFAHVIGWWYMDTPAGTLVVIELVKYNDQIKKRSIIVAKDGPWTDELLSQSVGGGGSSGSLRVAAGGYYAQFLTPALVNFPAADQWVNITNAMLPLLPYGAAGTSNCSYDTANNLLRLDWVPPVPTTASWLQGFAVLTTAATTNNQEYAIAWTVNGIVEPDFQVRFIRENPNDSETVMLHGHRQVPNLTTLGLAIKNLTSTSPLAVNNVNFRFYGGNNQ